LEPVLCDVSYQTLDLDREELGQLIDGDSLAVIPVHLYGLAQDVRDLITLGQERDFFVIEDAAQALGATFSGQMVGTWGDAGLYSLGRGKCLPAGSGGVIVAGERCSQAISDAMVKSVHASRSWDIASLLTFAGYGLATHPRGWWLVARTPLNPSADGMDVEALPPIRVAGLSSVLAGIGTSILERLKEVQSVNKKNAQHLMEQLAHFTFATFPRSAPEARPVFLRLPVVLERKEQADRLFAALQQQGIGVSRSYYHTLPDLFPGIVSNERRKFPGALRLAECMLTLPTHSYLEREDFSRIVKAFHMIDTKENMDHASTTA
jgi:dTDP-4-amino-4,6-dideoxygalactose transaminase